MTTVFNDGFIRYFFAIIFVLRNTLYLRWIEVNLASELLANLI